MSTKQSGGAAASSRRQQAPADAVSELSRRQMAALVQGGCALFRGFETIRGIQQRTAHAALAEYLQAAGKLARPQPMADLVALQAELLRFDLQGAAQYWQQLGTAALEMQRQLLAAAGAAETAALQDAAGEVQEFSSAMPGMAALFQTRANGRASAPRAQH